MADSNVIVLKTRDIVALSCIGGVCIGFGAFSIFHYLTNTRSTQQRPSHHKSPSGFENTIPDSPRGPTALRRMHSDAVYGMMGDTVESTFDDEDLKGMDESEKIQALKEHTFALQNMLQIARTQKYDIQNPYQLSVSDIETIRSIFDSMDGDQDGLVTDQELINIYSRLGEPLTDKEAIEIVAELDPQKKNAISFDTFLSWWHEQHKGGKKNKSYAEKFKFVFASITKSDFAIDKVHVKSVGQRNTTEFRYVFHYEQKNKKLKQISPWHDIPLHHHHSGKGGQEISIFNFVCEIPKWSRAKFEISTGEQWNPIHQDVKNGKLRFYQHGDMFFNYGAFPQTWENPKHTPKDTGCPGDNDPLDVIEFGTRQLATGSVTPVKVLGVLALLDSGETDWKILAININDPLANLMNDVHDFETHMPGALHAIREFLRIYKVCTGASANKFAFRGEALNSDYALQIIEETHEEWVHLTEQNRKTV